MNSADMDARDTNTGPVPKTGLSSTTRDFHLYNKASLFQYSLSTNISPKRQLRFSTQCDHASSLAQSPRNNGSRDQVQYYMGPAFTPITVSEALTCLCFNQAGIQFGRLQTIVCSVCWFWSTSSPSQPPLPPRGVFLRAHNMRSMRKALFGSGLGGKFNGGRVFQVINGQTKSGRASWMGIHVIA
jgi:hypothetical protein